MADEKCEVEHGDRTGVHTRISSCPAPEFDPASSLIVQIMAANQRAMEFTMNQLYNSERQMRLAREVWHNDFMRELDLVRLGTAREYEEVINFFAVFPYGREEELARRHRDWSEPL